jgi:hypothetical protein
MTEIDNENVSKFDATGNADGINKVDESSKKTNTTKKVVTLPKKSEILKRYLGKSCSLTNGVPCTVHMCSLDKCERVKAYTEAGGSVKKPLGSWKGSNQSKAQLAISALERRTKK